MNKKPESDNKQTTEARRNLINGGIDFLQIAPNERPITPPHHFATHSEVSPHKWFETVYTEILNSTLARYDSRINGSSPAPFRIPFASIPTHAIKYAHRKLYMMPGVFKIRKQCRGKGMRHEDVLFDPVRVIDMDRAKGDTPATLQQVELVAGMLPGAAILRSNGMQVFFRSSEPWEVEAPMLAALGRHLEFFLYPLFYDDCCHLKLDGTPGNHRNHCYRAPWGSCDQGPVRCWIPETDRLMTVREAFNQLGLDLPAPSVGFVGFSDPEDAEEIPLTVESRKMSTKSTSSRGGSLAPNYEEFDRIRQLLTNLLKQGLSRQEAEAKILAMPWEHHSRDGLKTTLPTVRPKKARPSDSRWLSDGEWATICADLAELPLRLGPCSTKRWLLQKNYSIRATRAWSFEFLFYDDMNCEEAIASFFKWREFEKIRYLSTTAIGEAAVVEDLRNCWNKFNNPDYLSNPYSNLKKVAKKTVDAVYRIAKQLMTFKMADIKNEVHISATQIRAALNELYDEGKVDRTKKNKGRIYTFVENKVDNALNECNNLYSSVDI